MFAGQNRRRLSECQAVLCVRFCRKRQVVRYPTFPTVHLGGSDVRSTETTLLMSVWTSRGPSQLVLERICENVLGIGLRPVLA